MPAFYLTLFREAHIVRIREVSNLTVASNISNLSVNRHHQRVASQFPHILIETLVSKTTLRLVIQAHLPPPVQSFEVLRG